MPLRICASRFFTLFAVCAALFTYSPHARAQCLDGAYSLQFLYLVHTVEAQGTPNATLNMEFSICNVGTANATVLAGEVPVELYFAPDLAVPAKVFTLPAGATIAKNVCNSYKFSIPQAAVPSRPTLTPIVRVEMNSAGLPNLGIFSCHNLQHPEVSASITFTNPYYLPAAADVDLTVRDPVLDIGAVRLSVCNDGSESTPVANVAYHITSHAVDDGCRVDPPTGVISFDAGLGAQQCKLLFIPLSAFPSATPQPGQSSQRWVRIDSTCQVEEKSEANNAVGVDVTALVTHTSGPQPTEGAADNVQADPAIEPIEKPEPRAEVETAVSGGCSLHKTSPRQHASNIALVLAGLIIVRRRRAR